FPCPFVVFLVCQHEASQDSFPRVKNLRDEPVVIAFDIEDGAGSNRIGVTEILSSFRQVIPISLLRNVVPSQQWLPGLRMLRPEFSQSLFTDDAHSPHSCFFPAKSYLLV